MSAGTGQCHELPEYYCSPPSPMGRGRGGSGGEKYGGGAGAGVKRAGAGRGRGPKSRGGAVSGGDFCPRAVL